MSSEKEKVGEVIVAGRKVPVYYESKSGEMVVPSNVEKEIVLDFVGRTLALPVTSVIIVAGGFYRDIRVTYEKIGGFIDNEINAIKEATDLQNYKIRQAGLMKRMSYTFQSYGAEFAKLSNEQCIEFHFDENLKRSYAKTLEIKMQQTLNECKV